jgi:tRNA(fMet)-specific endonuclease VapC
LLVLDTDHFSELERNLTAGARLAERLEAASDEKAVTVITLEEQMRGWLAEISRHSEPHRQVSAYAKLQRQVDVFTEWTILGWDDDSADLFLNFRRQGVRIGSMDLKIACIALGHECTLLTRNSRHFANVPDLRIENWLD